MRDTPKVGSGLRLFNSMGRSLQEFSPRDPSLVRIFTCGPSVYSRPHLGNYRTFLFEDVLVRYLRFKGYGVKRVMNITDIEDRSVLESLKQRMDIGLLTKRIELEMLKEFRLFDIELPDRMPRSSRSVAWSVRIVRSLLEKGIAYRHGADIFYDPLKFKGFGRLYGLDMSKWPRTRRRFKKDTYPGMRWNRGDFILWHGCRDGGDVCFDDVLGPGRPSWNVQDGAMAMETLGPSIDIWCGGVDNLIRHHDYNIAVVEAYSGEELAPFWLHGGHLLLKGKKMSKSKGNVVYPRDLVSQGYTWKQLRSFLLGHAWNEPLDLNPDDLKAAATRSERLRRSIAGIRGGGEGSDRSDRAIKMIVPMFERAMDDNLDLSGALDALEGAFREIGEERLSSLQKGELLGSLKKVDGVLRILF